MSKKRRNLPIGLFDARVERFCDDGRGYAVVDDRPVRLTGALPGELVSFHYRKRARRFDEGLVESVSEPASSRVMAKCAHFGICGGCVLQHLDHKAQIQLKQTRLLERFADYGLEPFEVLEPLVGPAWGYRNKARMGAKWLDAKTLALVGFRERGSGRVAVLERCEILHPAVGEHINSLRELLASLDGRERIPQIELAAGDEGVALVFRHLDALGEQDMQKLSDFGRHTGLQIFLQSGGPDTVCALWPAEPEPLVYEFPDTAVRLEFSPLDFTQVNPAINRALVNQALTLLAPGGQERVLDLFCGLGNFTLSLARRAGQVVGLEGEERLAAKGRHNASLNNIDNTQFYAVDLNDNDAASFWLSQHWHKLLLDPPRSGALEVVQRVPVAGSEKILYISCNPETLARDAAILVRERGYQLSRLGIIDMFPHTNHVESMALFEAV